MMKSNRFSGTSREKKGTTTTKRTANSKTVRWKKKESQGFAGSFVNQLQAGGRKIVCKHRTRHKGEAWAASEQGEKIWDCCVVPLGGRL